MVSVQSMDSMCYIRGGASSCGQKAMLVTPTVRLPGGSDAPPTLTSRTRASETEDEVIRVGSRERRASCSDSDFKLLDR